MLAPLSIDQIALSVGLFCTLLLAAAGCAVLSESAKERPPYLPSAKLDAWATVLGVLALVVLFGTAAWLYLAGQIGSPL